MTDRFPGASADEWCDAARLHLYLRWRGCTIYAPLVTVGVNHENRGFASRCRIPSCRQCCPHPSRSNRIVDVQTPFWQSFQQALGCRKFQYGLALHVSLT